MYLINWYILLNKEMYVLPSFFVVCRVTLFSLQTLLNQIGFERAVKLLKGRHLLDESTNNTVNKCFTLL